MPRLCGLQLVVAPGYTGAGQGAALSARGCGQGPSPRPGPSWVRSPEGLLMSSTCSGCLQEEMGRGWGGGGAGEGIGNTCSGGGRPGGGKGQRRQEEEKPYPQEVWCSPPLRNVGCQAPGPCGRPRASGLWGDWWKRSHRGPTPVLQAEKAPNPWPCLAKILSH